MPFTAISLDNYILNPKTKYGLLGLANTLKGIGSVQGLRKRLYDNVSPFSYTNYKQRLKSAVLDNKKDPDVDYYGVRDPIWAKYLNIPESQRHKGNRFNLVKSNYTPSKSKDKNKGPYYKHPTLASNNSIDAQYKKDAIEALKNIYWSLDENENTTMANMMSDAFGTYTVGRGFDNKGAYVSYYDLWDLAPNAYFGDDESMGVGTPIQFYDRLYLDDVMGLQPGSIKGTHWLPPVHVDYNKKTKKLDTYVVGKYFNPNSY